MSGEPLTERATLHRIIFKVRPLPGHPLYWECQFGLLNVWLYADSLKAASETATAITLELPYERVGNECKVSVCAPEPATERSSTAEDSQEEEIRVQSALRRQLARESGLSLLFAIVPTGADEEDFEMIPM